MCLFIYTKTPNYWSIPDEWMWFGITVSSEGVVSYELKYIVSYEKWEHMSHVKSENTWYPDRDSTELISYL